MLFSQKNIKHSKKVRIFNFSPPNNQKIRVGKRAPHATFCLQKGSLTLEASYVIPLFIAALVMMIFIVQAMYVQIRFQKALYQQTKEMAGTAYFVSEVGENYAVNLLEAEYVKAKVISEIGKEWIDSSYIYKGSKGISLNVSALNEEGYIDVILQYKMYVPFDLFKLGKLKFVSRARVWIGSETEAGESEEDGQSAVAYVTAHGSVYHLKKDCTYIQSEVASCSLSAIANKRNESGAKYYPCTVCGEEASKTVYYTKYGSRYHSRADCRNLKSSVYAMDLEKAKAQYPLCSKCAKENN